MIPGSRLYVGNIPYTSTEDDIREAFAEYGDVVEVKFINDKETGRFKGFGFVQMKDVQAAKDATAALDGHDFGGRTLNVSEAKERTRTDDRRGSGGDRRR